MKKHLLFAFMLMAVVAIQAQTVKMVNPTPALAKGLQIVKATADAETNAQVPYKPYKTYPVSTKDIQALAKIQFGSSANPYSILLASQNCLTYCPELDLIMFTHRQTHTNAGGSGFIQASFSADEGTTWEQNIVYSYTNGKHGRYPSGVIYNPSGNTNIDNAFAVVAGPYTDGTGWQGHFYASSQLDSTNNDIKQIDDANANTYPLLIRNFMNVDNQGRIRLYGEKNTDDGQYYTSYTTTVSTGTFNSISNSWDWAETDMIPDYTVGSSGNPDGYRSPGMAWSKDGETGYMVHVGRNASAPDPLAYHPVIYKTTNGGGTWSMLPGFDYTALPEINANLTDVAGAPGTKRALFSLIDDAVVDANGRLHFACMINSAYSSHPDSLGYYWSYTNLNGIMYHIWETASGWDAGLIDIVWGADIDAATTPIPDATWDYRLQMSKTPDEQHIVFAWMDTDTLITDINLYPDLLAQVYNINTGGRTATNNITAGTSYYSDNYYMFLSDWSGFDAVTGEVILHMTTSDFGATDLDPAYHSYLKDARILASVSEFNSVTNGNLLVSQNYPNPFNDQTSIDITLKVGSDVTVEVYNIMGQVVSSNYYQLTAGTHTVQISGQNMSSGIYFYSVHTAMGTVTKKMIVK